MQSPSRATGPAHHLADALWSLFRSKADRVLAREPRPWGDAHHDAVRGAAYLLLVDLIADLVDRVEHVKDPALRDRIVDLVCPDRVGGSRTA